jgi:ubiquinone/menaquinone biosynthesis C-methylase UbiE
MIKKSQILKMYDGHKYDEAMGSIYRDLIDRKYFVSLLKAEGKKVILEACCGTGLNFKFYPKGSEVYAVDLHPKMLKIAKKRARNKQIKIIKNDASTLKFKNNRFDIVLETLGLCVAPNPQAIFKEMVRVTKSGGLIAVFDMCVSPRSEIALAQSLMRKHTTEIGFPEGVILWDPTINFEKISSNLPIKLIFKKLVDANTPWCRGYFVWKKLG